MVNTAGWLERVPTYKRGAGERQKQGLTYLRISGVSALQTADIVIYSELGSSTLCAVGEDQVSHVEFSRELVRRFNTLFGL